MTQRATPPGEPGHRRFADRVVDVATRAFAWTDRYTQSAQAWAQRQEEHSRTGVALGWFGRYRQADGQQFALLLAAYFFVTLLPAVIAVATYTDSDPEPSKRPFVGYATRRPTRVRLRRLSRTWLIGGSSAVGRLERVDVTPRPGALPRGRTAPRARRAGRPGRRA
jgi:hypothetical protein